MLLGCFGFSSNSVMVSSPSTFMMPKRLASSQGTSITAMVQSACTRLWCASMAA